MPVKTKREKVVGVILWIAVFVVTLIIFVFSNMVGDVSSEVSEPLVEKTNDFVSSHIVKDLDERSEKDRKNLRNSISVFVRKTAHGFEYFLLGLLFFWRFRLYGANLFRAGAYSMCISLILAIADEYHQTLVPGRFGCLGDVMIDSVGILVGISAAATVSAVLLQKKKRKAKNERFAIG